MKRIAMLSLVKDRLSVVSRSAFCGKARSLLCRNFSHNTEEHIHHDACSLEIEIKFRCSTKILDYCTKQASHVDEVRLCDTYFDTKNYDLTRRDMWLRSRNGLMELKSPPSQFPAVKSEIDNNNSLHDTQVDFYKEQAKLGDIARTVCEQTGLIINVDATSVDCDDFVKVMGSSGIYPFGTIASRRLRHYLRVPIPFSFTQQWEASPYLRPNSSTIAFQDVYVDLDFVSYAVPDQHLVDVDFGVYTGSTGDYQIGEIEFVNEGLVSMLDEHDVPTAVRTQFQRELMRVVCNAVGIETEGGTGAVRGKVLEFLYRYCPAHYQALADCGQLASKGIHGPATA